MRTTGQEERSESDEWHSRTEGRTTVSSSKKLSPATPHLLPSLGSLHRVTFSSSFARKKCVSISSPWSLGRLHNREPVATYAPSPASVRYHFASVLSTLYAHDYVDTRYAGLRWRVLWFALILLYYGSACGTVWRRVRIDKDPPSYPLVALLEMSRKAHSANYSLAKHRPSDLSCKCHCKWTKIHFCNRNNSLD